MLAASEKKIEKDYTEAVDAALPSALLLAQSGKVLAAVESLLPLEKQTRGVCIPVTLISTIVLGR